ncbi:MAG TPA: heparinase II/III family protein [Armatimonadota bacterium]
MAWGSGWIALATALIAVIALEGEAKPLEVTLPPRARLLALLKPVHPRLLATADDFAGLKKRCETEALEREWLDRIRRAAQPMLTEEPARYEIPDGLRLLATSRRVVSRVQYLGLLYRLEGNRAYVDRLWKELDAAAHFPDWNPRHFLDTAEMTHAFALAYDWLYDAWTPEQRDALRKAIVEKGLGPALACYRGRSSFGWWVKANHNWNQVCNGGIVCGALALADVEPELCGEILESALRSLPLAMEQFSPDGAWPEGPGYWSYATEYNVLILAALDSALGTDFGLSKAPGFDHTGDFPLFMTGPIDRTLNYADGGDGAPRPPQMLWLAKRFSQPAYAAYEQQHAAPAPLDLLWLDRRLLSSAAKKAPPNRYFRRSEVASFRGAWKDRAATFIGFKAGDNRANHSHLDLGSFVMDALGVRWVLDLGADDYNLPAYFGNQRWSYYRLRAEGHNTLVLNPSAAPDQDPKALATITRFESKPRRAFAIADLSPAYAPQASGTRRGIALLNRRSVLIQDEVMAGKPVDLWWFLHTRAAVELSPDGRGATLTQDGKQLHLRLLSPDSARLTVMDAAPLPASPHPAKQNPNSGVRKLAIHLPNTQDLRLAVELTPADGGPESPAEVVPLAKW